MDSQRPYGYSFVAPGNPGPPGKPGISDDLVTLGSLYRPPVGMHPTATTLSTLFGDFNRFNSAYGFYAYDDSTQQIASWFNKQGHNWIKDPNGPFLINHTTTRIYDDVLNRPYPSGGEVEVLFYGKELALTTVVQGVPKNDVVFGTVVEDGVTYRLPDQDGSDSQGTGYKKFHWVFPIAKQRKIRLFLNTVGLHSIFVEHDAEISAAPDRPLVPIVSDSYTDAASWGRSTWSKEYQILTGFRVHESGQGSTGWFDNGSGQYTDMPGNSAPLNNRYRFFAPARLAKLADLALGSDHEPLFLLTNGSGNDVEFVSSAKAVRDRVYEDLTNLQEYDPLCRVVSIGWEPVTIFKGPAQAMFDDGLGQAHKDHSLSAGVVYPASNNGRPWFGGGGTVASVPSPPTSESRFVDADQVHLDGTGPATSFWAAQVAETTRNFKVHGSRAKL